MLPIQLRVLLVAGALLAFIIICRRIRNAKILVEDSIFWFLTSFVIVLLAAFPQIAITVSRALGFISPSNFVYLVILALLLWKVFVDSSKVSLLKYKISVLTQELALLKAEIDNDRQNNTKQ